MSQTASAPARSGRDRVLAVDDSPDSRLLVQSILEAEGYAVSLAESGWQALASVERAPPSLLLLDVMMPELDGFEVTRRIRANPNLPFVPILLVTAYDRPNAAQGLDSGADDFLRKPLDVDELLARVRSLLRLKHSVDERDEIARQRADFVSRLTHDLRTPLVAADRMLSLFQQGAFGELNESMREAVDTMASSNRSMLDMVNTLLEVYRHEAGRKTYDFTRVDLRALLGEVLQELEPLARERGLALHRELDAGEAAIVSADRVELRRVLANLVDNAIKFTDAGWVAVRLQSLPYGKDGRPWLAVEVADTGRGISPQEQQTLFERFRQGQHGQAGSGLGLHLSQRIAQQHGGTITLRSQVGEGSTFTLKLPAQPQSNARS
ncbi:MAG: hybrid sensor histidine kinase/response regulator [Cyanobacteria bacterium QS_8_64_29]|nr:MAG: hybrid sensor histidine kinase/response regulator [Cyanobacteria bacterium QS_8_64_29]